MKGIRLNKSDSELLDFLRDQGIATYQQAKNYFYSDYKRPQHRIGKLLAAGYLESRSIIDLFKKKSAQGTEFSPAFFPYLLGLNLSPSSKLLVLSESYRKQLYLTNKLMNRTLLVHQLMLNEVRVFVESKINESIVLNDPKLMILADIFADRRREFTPDLSIEAGSYVVAIEMERTQKSFEKYASRLNFYLDSAYSHIIYFYSNEKNLRSFIKYVGPERRVAFAHYLKPQELLSPAWGVLDFHTYVDKVNSIV